MNEEKSLRMASIGVMHCALSFFFFLLPFYYSPQAYGPHVLCG